MLAASGHADSRALLAGGSNARASSGQEDSVLLLAPDGQLLLYSNAALGAAAWLDWPWPLLALLGRIFPRLVRDAVYNVIGRNRLCFFPLFLTFNFVL